MSILASKWAWSVAGIGSSEKLVLVALADFADSEGGSCYPSCKTLAKMTSLNVRTVKRVIKKLEASGHVIKVAGGGRARSNRYRLPVTNSGIAPPFCVQEKVASGPETVALGPANGGTTPPDPVVIHQEPSTRRMSTGSKAPSSAQRSWPQPGFRDLDDTHLRQRTDMALKTASDGGVKRLPTESQADFERRAWRYCDVRNAIRDAKARGDAPSPIHVKEIRHLVSPLETA